MSTGIFVYPTFFFPKCIHYPTTIYKKTSKKSFLILDKKHMKLLQIWCFAIQVHFMLGPFPSSLSTLFTGDNQIVVTEIATIPTWRV